MLVVNDIVFFSWVVRIYRNSRLIARRPKFAPVFFSILLSVVVLGFLNIYPFSIPRYAVTSFVSQAETSYKKSIGDANVATTSKPVPVKPATSTIVTLPDNKAIVPTVQTPKSSDANTSRVWINSNTYLVGATGNPIILVNNPNATNPTWNQLINFIKQDETDKHPYLFRSFVCADFAEMLHNSAEKAGIRAAFVSLQLGSSPDYPMGGGHACNAFQTTDRGLVYIDCTRYLGAGPSNADKIVDVKVGQDYRPKALFPEPGWYSPYGMGEVLKIEVLQW